MSDNDAIDAVLAFRTGAIFRRRGRVFMIRGYEGWTHGVDARGDYCVAAVWNDGCRATTVKVRPSDKIEVLT